MDTTLTIQRITFALDKTFDGLIDMSDVQQESGDAQRSKFLSRALAAFAVQCLTEADPGQAAASVTDGFDDQGIDAIYFDPGEKTVYLVQSKWSGKGTKTIEQGEVEKFLKGVQALILPNFAGFNEKVRKHESELRTNLLMRSDVRVVLVIAHTSPEPLGRHVSDAVQDFLNQQNNVGDTEVFTSETFDLKRVYGRLSGSSNGKIKFQIILREWGMIEKPYRAFYGQVLVSEIAAWAPYGKALFAKNLRYFRGASDVNLAIDMTLTEVPSHFWYFNNGITILCTNIEKTVAGGSTRDIGVFDCQGISIVNGAQTVGVIWELSKRGEAYIHNLTSSVNIRMISLQGCPEDFGRDVTRAANTQNPIQHRDFAALDPEQHRLAKDFSLDGRRYAFKSGDPDPKGDEGCNIEDATVALACANPDVNLTVQAKREVGLLWKRSSKATIHHALQPSVILTNRMAHRSDTAASRG